MSPIFTGSGFGYRRRSDSNLLFLLHMDGSNDSTTFIDSSTNTIPVNAITTKISTAQSKFGGSSALINGGYLQTSVNQALSISTQDYTVEGWVYLTIGDSGGYNTIFMLISSSGSFSELRFGDAGYGHVLQFNTGPSGFDVVGFKLTKSSFTNTWKHFALVRQSGQIYVYIDGIQIIRNAGGGTTVPHNLSRNVYLLLGGGSGAFSGYIDEFRISSFARYSNFNFNVPSEEFSSSNDSYFSSVSLLLNMNGSNNSTTITDSSSSPITVTAVGDAKISNTQSKFGGTSLALDGTGDYGLINTSMTSFEFSGDFTIEGWWWFNVNNVGYQGLLGSSTGPDTTPTGFLLACETNNVLVFYGSSTTSWNTVVVSSQVPTINTWHHIAVSRIGNNVGLFYDGILIGTTTSSNFIRSGSALRVGGYQSFPGGARSFNGYIDDLRITKGVGRYACSFTPPSAPFPDP